MKVCCARFDLTSEDGLTPQNNRPKAWSSYALCLLKLRFWSYLRGDRIQTIRRKTTWNKWKQEESLVWLSPSRWYFWRCQQYPRWHPCESQEPIDVVGQQNVLKDVRTSNWSDPASAEAFIEQLSKAGDDADAVYVSLPPEAQAEVLEYLKVTQVRTSVSTTEGHVLADGGRGCNSCQYQVDWCNAPGQTLFSYFQKIDWCYNGLQTDIRTTISATYLPLNVLISSLNPF